VRLKSVEQPGIAFAKLGSILRPPDSKIAEIAIAFENE
jgi:hypothetical protein